MPRRRLSPTHSEQVPRCASRYGLRPARLAQRLQHNNKEIAEPGQHLHLSTADPTKVGFHPWLNIQSARWLKFGSARTNDMAQRSRRQDTFKGIEVLMRLALKAQAQARSTAEALALLKNPMPYIKQANMTTGPQQVNNTYAGTPSHSGIQSGAGNSRSEPNKLLEADHGQRLDIGAQAAAGRANQVLETVGAVHRADHA